MPRNSTRAAVSGSTKTSVEVLLAEDVSPLGTQGEIVKVKPGYARNYLLPYGLATVATEENKKMVEEHKKRVAAVRAKKLADFKKLADSVNRYSVTLEANASKDGHLYGSIVARDISEALKTAGFEIEPDHIKLEGPLRELGMYTVKVRLHADVETETKVWVVPSATN